MTKIVSLVGLTCALAGLAACSGAPNDEETADEAGRMQGNEDDGKALVDDTGGEVADDADELRNGDAKMEENSADDGNRTARGNVSELAAKEGDEGLLDENSETGSDVEHQSEEGFEQYGSGRYAVMLSSAEDAGSYCWYIEETFRTSIGGEQSAVRNICIDNETNCLLHEPVDVVEDTSSYFLRIDYETVSGNALTGSCDILDAYWTEGSDVQCLYHAHCPKGQQCRDWQCVCPEGVECAEFGGPAAPTPVAETDDEQAAPSTGESTSDPEDEPEPAVPGTESSPEGPGPGAPVPPSSSSPSSPSAPVPPDP